MSLPAQITVLLALTAGLFDHVPLDQIIKAEHVFYDAVADIPVDVSEQLDTVEKLSDKDRETIIQIASKSLVRFQPKPEANGELKSNESTLESLSRPEPKPEPEQKAE